MKIIKKISILLFTLFVFIIWSCSHSIPGLDPSTTRLGKKRKANSHSAPVGDNIKTKYKKPVSTRSIDRMY